MYQLFSNSVIGFLLYLSSSSKYVAFVTRASNPARRFDHPWKLSLKLRFEAVVCCSSTSTTECDGLGVRLGVEETLFWTAAFTSLSSESWTIVSQMCYIICSCLFMLYITKGKPKPARAQLTPISFSRRTSATGLTRKSGGNSGLLQDGQV